MERRPRVVDVVEGSWWSGAQEAEVALPRMAAQALGARVGSRIVFDATGLTFTARVALIDRIGPLDRLRCCLLFSPSAPVQSGAVYHGIAEVRPGSMAAVRRALYRAFPTVTTIDVTESLRLLESWLDAVLWSARLIAALAMAAAMVLLGSTVAATRMWRIREIAILKALGARRAKLIRIYAVEFTLLGCAAGVIGVLVSAAWSRLVPSAGAVSVALGGAALLANAGGWLAAFRYIGRKPLETLRGE
jgi:putative ABC transport system permease protein